MKPKNPISPTSCIRLTSAEYSGTSPAQAAISNTMKKISLTETDGAAATTRSDAMSDAI